MTEFRRGWPLLAGCFIGISAGVSSIYFYSLGVFLKPVSEAFGWTHGQASLGPLAGTLGAAIASIPTGRLVDRVGPRRMAIVSMMLLALGFAALSLLTQSLGSFLLITALLSFLTVGCTPISYTRLIVGQFEKQRGLALGLTLAATGVGAMITPPLLGPFIAAHGWRAAYLLLGAIVLVCTIPVTLLIGYPERVAKPSAEEKPPRFSDFALSRPFLLLSLIFFLGATGVLGAVVQFPAMLSDFGVPLGLVGKLTGLIGLAVIVGRTLCGFLLDRVPAQIVTAIFFSVSAVGLIALAIGRAAAAPAGALALGMSVGAEADLLAFLVARLFPKRSYGSVYGAVYTFFLAGRALGPVLVGFGYDFTGGYSQPLLLLGTLVLAAGILALMIPRAALADAGLLMSPRT